MSTLHNLYLMLHPPLAITQDIGRLQRLLNRSYHGPSKPMAAERLHTTLVPLGSYEHQIPREVVALALLAGSLLDTAPFRVCFDTLQSRGPHSEIGTVELAGHGTGVRPLYRLRRELVAALLSVGWPEAWIRPSFYPHITVDYERVPVGVRRVEPLAWDVTEVRLVDSLYGQGRHEVLASWPLQDRQPSLFD
ncbi:2'-5' RNA ligase family protein [Hydrogenophaga pseudoflava]|uniref:2'-5' RNA ligase family protein n=1 Tax=Hydrogenophaga pseudoflava TaxID=47421 RepID=UPI0027E5BCA0|nr:2'-5' RNA ligase family protein [Hydrogenophaga pseudoflava]MDQ7744545.1 2'-5' RNA ligase family protein [Hydrogenophaga pseudoflava]